LSYVIQTLPTNGTLSDNGTVITADDLPKTTTSTDLIYVSTSDTATSDSFTFIVNDGTVDSEAATISLAITAVNDVPVATAQTDVAATEQTEVTITLAGTDAESDAITFIVSTLPTNGTLSDNGTVITADDLPKTTTSPDVVYVSTSDIAASDSFTFKVNDGSEDSEAATIGIAIATVNDEPTKVNLSSLVIDENSAATEIGTLSTDDLDTNDTFTYELVSGEGDTDNSLFTIETDKIKNNDAFDFETKSSYSLRIKSTDSGSASIEGVFAITVNNINDISISSEITSTYCDGSDAVGAISIVTSNTNGEVVYSWTGPNGFSSTDQNLTGLESGTYELTVKDDSFEKSIEIVVEKTEIFNELSVCYVTTDSDDFTKNRIFLSYKDIYNDKKYEILREGSEAGVYEKIGEIDSGESSFLDTSSNNSSSSYSYKVRLVDNCDVASTESSGHRTILLQSSLAVDNSVNLNWNSYEGVNYSTYKIYRRVNNGDFEELTAISSTNNSYNDTEADVTQNAYAYYVSIAVESCTTTQKTAVKENVSNNFRYTSRVNETTEIKSNQKFIQDDNGDYDNDGVLNAVDSCLDTPEGSIVDVNGCAIFTLPLNNNKVSVISASCIGNTDGSIGLSIEDASYAYSVTVTGKDDPITLGGDTKTASVTGLGTGTYTVCFKVDGQDAYEQCFEVNIGEPKAISAFIDVDNDNKTTSIQLSGSSSYNVEVNGERYDVKGDRFTTNLPTGLSIIKISTDLDCQGIIEREVFISEDIHYYPNPTQTDVNVHVSGEDTTVQVSVFSEKGDLIYTREQQIQDFSRKTNIDLSRQITGTYIVVMDGPTVRKTFKIVKR
ncbi:cadherin-like domain-containing protein, partial [Flavobacteriaceae bacterium]|nr:cadherin-like domain-containing protein [Flavobacteriaceae bacterium]